MQDPDNKPHSGLNNPQPEWNEVLEDDAAVEHAIAPPRKRKRTARARVNVDESTELRNSDLANWRDNYLINMAEQAQKRQLGKETHNAKMYAHKIVFEWGIGGELRNPTLKSFFSGGALLETFQNKPKAAKCVQTAGETLTEGSDVQGLEAGKHDEQLGLAFEKLDDYGPQINDYDVRTAFFVSEIYLY